MAERNDRGSPRTVQVVMSWGGNPHREVSVRAGGRVVIGDGAATFLVPSELGLPRFELVTSDAARGFLLRAPAGATLRAARDGVDVSGEARTSEDGVRELAIDPALRAEVSLGELSFFVQEGEASAVPLARPDLRGWRWVAASLAVHAAFLFSFLFAPPDAGALSLDLTHEQRQWVRARYDALEREVVAPEVVLAEPEGGGAGSEPAPGEQGTAGAPDETRATGGGVRVRGDRDDRRIALDRASVTSAGALGTIAAFSRSLGSVSSPYGASDALGFSVDEAYGALMADAGFSRGSGGISMSGTGHGAGCAPGQFCGQGIISSGGFTTGGTCGLDLFRRIEAAQGREAAIAQCSGYGSRGHGAATGVGSARNRESRVPPRIGCAPGANGSCDIVNAGRLTREQIRLVVTRNRGQLRSCYERALQQRPDLGGRLVVMWSVHQEGRVAHAAVAPGTDLRHPDLEQCVVQAVRRWQFPATDGATAVTYPFVFNTAD